MDVSRNPQLYRFVIERLQKEYLQDKPFPHVTELIYCLTKSYWNHTDPLPATDEEVLLFSVGWGMEKVLISGLHPEPVVVDDIHMSPDFMHLDGPEVFGELKTTRARPAKEGELPWISEGWVRQIQAYCRANGQLVYDLAVVHLIQPMLKCWRLSFTQEELDENWAWILARKEAYIDHFVRTSHPEPFQYNMEWECRYCRYKLRCDAWLVSQKGGRL